jgi:hypothetical protein
MPSTWNAYKIQQMATGENTATWGDITNQNFDSFSELITGSADVTFASGTVTLTLSDSTATQTARNLRLNLIGTSGGAQNLVVPAIEKLYLVNNGCADAITVKNSTGTGIAVPAGKTMWVFNNATNVVDVVTHLSSLTLGSALPVASGGTGITSFGTGVATALGQNVTGSGGIVLATSPTLVTPTLGVATATSVNKLTFTAPATSATLTLTDGKTLAVTNTLTFSGTDSTVMTFPPASASVGYLNVPQNSKSAAYTTVLADSGKHIYHPASDANARTFTIDSHANVAYPLGTAISFVNMTSQVVTIAITSDTLYLAGTGTTGSRSLAQYGVATALKVENTQWIISGSGLT